MNGVMVPVNADSLPTGIGDPEIVDCVADEVKK